MCVRLRPLRACPPRRSRVTSFARTRWQSRLTTRDHQSSGHGLRGKEPRFRSNVSWWQVGAGSSGFGLVRETHQTTYWGGRSSTAVPTRPSVRRALPSSSPTTCSRRLMKGLCGQRWSPTSGRLLGSSGSQYRCCIGLWSESHSDEPLVRRHCRRRKCRWGRGLRECPGRSPGRGDELGYRVVPVQIICYQTWMPSEEMPIVHPPRH